MHDALMLPDPLLARYLAPLGLEEAARRVSDGALYFQYCLPLELALLRALARRGFFSEALLPAAEEAARRVTTEEIRREEQRTRHDLKALVNVFCRHCPPEVRPYVHLGATSYDILSNAHVLRLRDGVRELVLPALRRVAARLAERARREADTPQIGRTHGQHAEPLSFGYSLAVYLDRLGHSLVALERSLEELRGKFSGAVGAYTTFGLLVEDVRELEREVLAEVGLEPNLASTQIVHPEPALAVLHHLVVVFGVLANLADDLRHLQRSEIAEVAEAYREESQVGSSAMPHKRNPITWENIKSLWKVAVPQILTYYLDQISEHQRDLTNSASARFIPRLVLLLAVAARRTERGLEGLEVRRETMAARLASATEAISGPAQTLLSARGVAGAHERVRRLAIEARRRGVPLLDLLDLEPEERRLLGDPARLIAPSARAAREVVAFWEERLGLA